MTGLIDCDNHCYEARDACTRYLPEAFGDHAIQTVRLANGAEVVVAGDRVALFQTIDGVGFDRVHRPGTLKEMLRQMGSGNPDVTYEYQPMQPEYVDRGARLARMDAQGVEQTVMFPACLALAAENFVKDTRALYANVHSFNRWYDETWGFNHRDRIFATALLSLRDRDAAVRETEHILERGAKVVLLPTGPACGRSPGDPYFDPVWARLNEAGVTVALHIMENWYTETISPAWGHDPYPTPYRMSAWQWQNTYGERAIQDTLSALIFDNLFARFPRLMVLAAEFGAEWLPHFLRHMDKSRGMGRNGPWIGGRLTERPSDILRHHVKITPYPEDDIIGLVDQLGGADILVMGSDYPHPEGLAEPAEFQKLIDTLDEATQRRILHDNGKQLLGSR